MGIRLRFLTAEIAILTAIASLFVTDTAEWTKVYERRLYAEMALNLWRAGSESQTSIEGPVQPGPERKTLEGIQPKIQDGSQSEAQTQMAAEGVVSESESVNEQTPVEEADIQLPAPTAPPVEEVPQNSTAETEASRPEETAPVYTQPVQAPLYAVDGDVLDPGVAEYLYRRLSEAGIGWFYEYAVCLAYQESSFNPLAINPNGRDFGLYQFRIEYYPGLDWSNPYAQTDLFVTMMANRAAAGCDVYTMISRHNTSDWAPGLNTVYINQVMSHFPALQRIR